MTYYKETPNWSKTQIKKIAGVLGLKEGQIYKWNWD